MKRLWTWLVGSSWALSACAALLGVTLAGGPIADFTYAERRVVLVDTRPIQGVTPPFTYDGDHRRFMRTVLMPVCPKPQEEDGAETMAVSCTATNHGIRIQLRDDLESGEAGKPVYAGDLVPWLARNLNGYSFSPDGFSLSITQDPAALSPPAVPPTLLLPWFQLQPAAIMDPDADDSRSRAPIGTGPFFVDELWCRDDRKDVQCTRIGDSPPVRLGDLDDWLEDVVVLRRRGWSWMSTTEIVVAGLKGDETDSSSHTEPAVTRADALTKALVANEVHCVFDIEADLETQLKKRAAQQSRYWRFSEPRQDRVLVAAVNRNSLDPSSRSRIIAALDAIRQEPLLLRSLNARPADQLFPEPFVSIHRWDGAHGEPGDLQDDPCLIDLVTNTNWEYAAERFRERLIDLDPGLDVRVHALDPAQEHERRKAGNYGISLLSLVYEPHPAAYFLWDNLQNGWATEEHMEIAAELAAYEVKEKDTEKVYAAIDALHKELDEYIIPMNAPTKVLAINDRLLGLDPGRWYLNPDDLRMASSETSIIRRSLLVALSVLLLTLSVTSYLSRRSAARRERLETSLRMLRHDLTAPVATIKAYAERLLRRESKTGVALLAEAEAALAVAEDFRIVLERGRLTAEGGDSTRLPEQVIEPILENLGHRAAYERAKAPETRIDLPADLPPVAVPFEVAKFVIRTLVENAWRHRGNRQLVLELVGSEVDGSLFLDVKDRGPGIAPHDKESLFREGFRSEAARKAYPEGSGMGLFLARKVLRQHGGDIWLVRDSGPTVFSVRFPLAPPSSAADETPNDMEDR